MHVISIRESSYDMTNQEIMELAKSIVDKMAEHCECLVLEIEEIGPYYPEDGKRSVESGYYRLYLEIRSSLGGALERKGGFSDEHYTDCITIDRVSDDDFDAREPERVDLLNRATELKTMLEELGKEVKFICPKNFPLGCPGDKQMPDMDHVMAVRDITESYGQVTLGPYILLYNENFVSQEEAIRIYKAGRTSPYVLLLPQKQFDGLFLNKKVN